MILKIRSKLYIVWTISVKNTKNIILPIEWLRALAVLAVVIYHFDKNLLPGGYLGVDIFLVISGYLVGGALVSNKNLNIKGFYSFINRRFWRLQPALVATLFISIILGGLYSTPEELISFGGNSLSSFLGYSNIYFWQQAGYFGGVGEYNLLLHTWSLSLEWQYYLSFGLLCLVFLYVNKRVLDLKVILLITIISFALAIFASSFAPSANFFLLPSRVWEFFIGTVVFVFFRTKQTDMKLNHKGLGFMIGAIICIISLMYFEESTSLPGWLTFFPIFGVSVCLACSSFTVNQVIKKSTMLPFLIGRSSYSIYLLHWPIIVVFSELFIGNVLTSILFIGAIIFLGYLMYKFIELPFSKVNLAFYIPLIGFGLILWLSKFVINYNDGFVDRFSIKQLDILESAKLTNLDRRHCLNVISRNDNTPLNIGCKGGDKPHKYLIWGDSHLETLRSYFTGKEIGVDFIGVAGCPPLINVNRLYGNKKCDTYSKEALNFIKNNHQDYKALIFGGRFSAYLFGNTSQLGSAEGGVHQYIYDVEEPKKDRLSIFRYRLNETLAMIAKSDIKVVLVGGIPEYGVRIPREMFRHTLFDNNSSNEVVLPLNIVNRRVLKIDNILINEANNYTKFYFYDPKSILCDEVLCKTSNNGIPIYFDDDHLNNLGADIVMSDLLNSLKKSGI